MLTLAEAEFFRVRWSAAILTETERAIARLLAARGFADAETRASRAVAAMTLAFPEANVKVSDTDRMEGELPDEGDRHVIVAARMSHAALIVTENLRHFPTAILQSCNLEVKNADSFIADTLDLDIGRAVDAMRRMRIRFNNPAISTDSLLLRMEASGLVQTVDLLNSYKNSL